MYFGYFSELTLESGIDIAPGINVALPLKHFHIRILIHFYNNQGIAVIFHFFLSSFQKLINVTLRLFRTLEYYFYSFQKNIYFVILNLTLMTLLPSEIVWQRT